MHMHYLDLAIWCVTGVGFTLGFKSGLIKQLGTLAGLILGVLACRAFGAEAVMLFADSEGATVTTVVVVYIVIFIVVYFGAKLLASLLRKLIHTADLGSVDRMGGAFLKAALWVFIMSLAFNLWSSITDEEMPTQISHWIQGIAPSLIDMKQFGL